MSHPLGQIFRFILKLVLGLSAAVLAACLLLVALTWLALGLLKALVTGRKPLPVMAFSRFRQFSQTRMQFGNRPFSKHPGNAPAQVVDVEAREVKDSGRPS